MEGNPFFFSYLRSTKVCASLKTLDRFGLVGTVGTIGTQVREAKTSAIMS